MQTEQRYNSSKIGGDMADNDKQKLMQKLNFRFKKILPKKECRLSPYNYLSNKKIMEFIEQFDIFIQLLLQNYLFIKDKRKKIQIHNLIDKINLKKNQMIFLSGQRSYDIYLIDFKFGNDSLNSIRYHLLN